MKVVQSTREWLTQPGGLAERLTQLREAAGLTGDQLAERLGWRSRSKIPKLENGRQMPSETDLRQWADATGVQDALDELLRLREAAVANHQQWRHALRDGHAAVQTSFDQLVRSAARVRSIQTVMVPGLLQTPDYARCRVLETVRVHGTSPDEVDETVAARMRRQEVLYDTGKQFEFIILEAAFRHLLCSPDVMRGQLDRLQSIIGMPNIRLGIIPEGRELSITPMLGFLMADDVVVAETFTSADTLRGEEAAKWGEIMDLMWPDAVEGEEARRVITRAAEDLRS